MGSSSDDFTALRALLKVKRYEQPPPRYWDDLADGIHSRLRGPDGLRRKSLFSLLGFDFAFRPALFYGLGVACCCVALYAGMAMLVRQPAPAAPPMTASSTVNAFDPALPAESSAHLLISDAEATPVSSSTNPLMSTDGSSLPMNPYKVRAVPVNYQPKP
ncbi:MAG: hypothetical protein HZA90_18795 [Verrucomicrobia bacterium]|nr:hypothetical protein [Verrucomicrobiota bacterium]